jgi:hypothetical protein
MARVCAFIHFCNEHTKATYQCVAKPQLPTNLPVIGPVFLPPDPLHFHHVKALSGSGVKPQPFCLKPITVVHPFYTPSLLSCPGCRKHNRAQDNTKLSWEGWTSTGPRHLHGLEEEGFTIGYQLVCNVCQAARAVEKEAGIANSDLQPYKWTTTNMDFWDGVPYWKVPREF